MNGKSNKRRWLPRCLIVLIVFALLGGGIITVAGVLCLADIPDIYLDESIDSFWGQGEYTANDLILAAEQHVKNTVWWIAESGTGSWTMGRYLCDEQGCELKEVITEITTQRYAVCFGRDPENVHIFRFTFNIEQNHLATRIFSLDARGSLFEPRFSDILPTIDEALGEVSETIARAVNDVQAPIAVYVELGRGHWTVFGRDASENEVFRTQVDFR